MSCNTSQVSDGGKNNSTDLHITKLNIKYIDVTSETIIRIECSKFETAFPEAKDLTITDSDYLNKFQRLLKQLKTSPNGRKPDVRIKANISYSDGSSNCLCLEGQKGAIQYNDSVVDFNEEIAKMIYDKMGDSAHW